MMRITSKRKWYEVDATGLFNRPRLHTWREFKALRGKDCDAKRGFGVRWLEPGHEWLGVMTWHQAVFVLLAGIRLGHYAPGDFLVSECTPIGSLVVQGEAAWVGGLFQCIASTVKLPMREAFKLGTFQATRAWLRAAMGGEDYGRLMETLEQWPGHAVEFTLFNERVGIHRERLVVWEVRCY